MLRKNLQFSRLRGNIRYYCKIFNRINTSNLLRKIKQAQKAICLFAPVSFFDRFFSFSTSFCEHADKVSKSKGELFCKDIAGCRCFFPKYDLIPSKYTRFWMLCECPKGTAQKVPNQIEFEHFFSRNGPIGYQGLHKQNSCQTKLPASWLSVRASVSAFSPGGAWASPRSWV